MEWITYKELQGQEILDEVTINDTTYVKVANDIQQHREQKLVEKGGINGLHA